MQLPAARTCVNNQANHAERCFIHQSVNAPRQDAKFLIRREIWPSTGSNRVGRLAEDRYSSEIANRIARLFRIFFQRSQFCQCNILRHNICDATELQLHYVSNTSLRVSLIYTMTNCL